MEANDALTKLAVEKKARLEIENREQQQKQQQNVEAKPKETLLSHHRSRLEQKNGRRKTNGSERIKS